MIKEHTLLFHIFKTFFVPSIWSNFINVSCFLEKNMYFPLLVPDCIFIYLYLLVNVNLLFKSSVCLLIFFSAYFSKSIDISHYDFVFLYFSLYIWYLRKIFGATLVCAHKCKICFIFLINCTFYHYEINFF